MQILHFFIFYVAIEFMAHEYDELTSGQIRM